MLICKYMKMTLETLPSIVQEIIQKVYSSNSGNATVITLEGDLGTGKTTLTQELARSLGVKENLISPTFVIMKKYDLPEQAGVKVFKFLVHIDAYRLTKSEELWKLGFKEILEDKNNLIIIEWPENVPDCVPKNALRIKLSHLDDNTRTIEISG